MQATHGHYKWEESDLAVGSEGASGVTLLFGGILDKLFKNGEVIVSIPHPPFSGHLSDNREKDQRLFCDYFNYNRINRYI